MAIKLKHFVVWYEDEVGLCVKHRTKHTAMEKLVNQIISGPMYVQGSMRVIVGTEVLTPATGKDLI